MRDWKWTSGGYIRLSQYDPLDVVMIFSLTDMEIQCRSIRCSVDFETRIVLDFPKTITREDAYVCVLHDD